jgi:hypothetical protein
MTRKVNVPLGGNERDGSDEHRDGNHSVARRLAREALLEAAEVAS